MALAINESRWDCVIVGAGRAGLTAAVYAGRYLRRVLVLHDNQSRAALILTSHNFPGYSGGISGVELLANLRRQAESYGAIIERSPLCSVRVDVQSRSWREGKLPASQRRIW